jgi:hypothetical protein
VGAPSHTLHAERRTARNEQRSVDIALAEAGRDGEVRQLGAVAGGVDAVSKALRRLVSRGHCVHVGYEADPCGFVPRRHPRKQAAPRRIHELSVAHPRISA